MTLYRYLSNIRRYKINLDLFELFLLRIIINNDN